MSTKCISYEERRNRGADVADVVRFTKGFDMLNFQNPPLFVKESMFVCLK
jgi:hypothetical protein